MLDVTAEKEAVARVDVAEAVTRALLANAMDAIVATDPAGIVVEFNPSAEQTFGYSRDEALGRSLTELIVPPDYRERHDAGLRSLPVTDAITAEKRGMDIPAMIRTARFRDRVGDYAQLTVSSSHNTKN